jgi:hypothetical protein
MEAFLAGSLIFINFVGAFRCKSSWTITKDMKDKYKSYTETGMASVFIDKLGGN